jgi:hypothetical protein
MGAPRTRLNRLNRWARAQLWWYAFIATLTVGIGLATRSLQGGYEVAVWIGIGIIAAWLGLNIIDGWFEWRRNRSTRGM